MDQKEFEAQLLEKDSRIAALEMRCHQWFQHALLMALAIDDLLPGLVEETQEKADAERASKLFKDYYQHLKDQGGYDDVPDTAGDTA